MAWPNSWNMPLTFVEAHQHGWPSALRQLSCLTTTGFKAEQPGLADVLVHPGAALLVVAREVVGQEQRQRRAVSLNLEHAHVLLVHRDRCS